VDAETEVGGNLKRILILAAFALAVRADTYYVTVAGLGGESEYEQRFAAWAKDLDKVLKAEPGAKVETLSGAEATKANIEAKLRTIAGQAKADDQVVLMLIGHGTWDDRDYKFALPGPDISAAELATLLDRIQARELVVDMTTSSGGAIPFLQKPKRAVITATKAGSEKSSVVVFTRYWIEALNDPAADTDKNEIISALEAFKYAEAKTTKFFETENRLATEHALLEDTGKGDGVKDPKAENGEGLQAGRFSLIHLGTSASISKDPKKLELLKKKEEIDGKLDELRYQKAAMDPREYRTQLQTLMVEMAQTQAELDK
jgi:hypothetical protein